MNVGEVVDIVTSRLKKIRGVKTIILSGSVARGVDNPHDIDLLVVVDSVETINEVLNESKRINSPIPLHIFFIVEDVALSQLRQFIATGIPTPTSTTHYWIIYIALSLVDKQYADKVYEKFKNMVEIQREYVILYGEKHLKKLVKKALLEVATSQTLITS